MNTWPYALHNLPARPDRAKFTQTMTIENLASELHVRLDRIEAALAKQASPYVATDQAAAAYAAIKSVRTWRIWRDENGIRNVGTGGTKVYVKEDIRKAREGRR